MAKKWELDEKTLIEVFGCVSLNDRIIELSGSKDKKMIKSDFYLDGNAMEGVLIETFGCISLDKIINIDVNRDKKKAELPLTNEDSFIKAVQLLFA
jgi:hypothetical protein